jgi:ribose-phosphate pyrophosphokinase
MLVMSGNSNRPLAESIASILNLPLAKVDIKRFDDSEIFVDIQESIRGKHVFLIQPLSAPVNDHLMTLLIMADSLRRSSAAEITAVVPYLGYGRQDRKMHARVPITARLVSDLLETAGIDRLVSVDFHSPQIEGFFKIPTDNLFAAPLFSRDIKLNFPNKNIFIASPDIGGVNRARAVAKRLGCDLVIVEKRRHRDEGTKVLNVIGNPSGQYGILIDDIVDSGGTLIQAAEALKSAGALGVSAYATHGILSANAYQKIEESCLDHLIITDSIIKQENFIKSKKIRIISMAPLLAEVISRIAKHESVSNLFDVWLENM